MHLIETRTYRFAFHSKQFDTNMEEANKQPFQQTAKHFHPMVSDH